MLQHIRNSETNSHFLTNWKILRAKMEEHFLAISDFSSPHPGVRIRLVYVRTKGSENVRRSSVQLSVLRTCFPPILTLHCESESVSTIQEHSTGIKFASSTVLGRYVPEIWMLNLESGSQLDICISFHILPALSFHLPNDFQKV